MVLVAYNEEDNMVCIGIDPSLRGTAVVCFKNGKFFSSYRAVPKKPKGKAKEKTSADKLEERLNDEWKIYRMFKMFLLKMKPDYIAIEGYSFGGKANLTTQAEVTGIIGLAITEYLKTRSGKVIFAVIQPTSVKKYITGKGSGKKELVLKQVYKEFGFDTENNNIADAFVIARMASDISYIAINKKYPSHIKPFQKEVFEKITFVKEIIKKIKRS